MTDEQILELGLVLVAGVVWMAATYLVCNGALAWSWRRLKEAWRLEREADGTRRMLDDLPPYDPRRSWGREVHDRWEALREERDRAIGAAARAERRCQAADERADACDVWALGSLRRLANVAGVSGEDPDDLVDTLEEHLRALTAGTSSVVGSCEGCGASADAAAWWLDEDGCWTCPACQPRGTAVEGFGVTGSFAMIGLDELGVVGCARRATSADEVMRHIEAGGGVRIREGATNGELCTVHRDYVMRDIDRPNVMRSGFVTRSGGGTLLTLCGGKGGRWDVAAAALELVP